MELRYIIVVIVRSSGVVGLSQQRADCNNVQSGGVITNSHDLGLPPLNKKAARRNASYPTASQSTAPYTLFQSASASPAVAAFLILHERMEVGTYYRGTGYTGVPAEHWDFWSERENEETRARSSPAEKL
jgi:hypothetical protein